MALMDGVSSYDDGTASNLAFKKTFRIGVQNKFLRTPELIKWMGTPSSGNRSLDRQLQENFVEIMATPIACVEYYMMGAPLRFRNSAIPNQILLILRQHVRNWDYIAHNFYNATLPPAEELDYIIEFCELIVKYAGATKRKDNVWLLSGRNQKSSSNNKPVGSVIGDRRKLRNPVESGSGEVKSGVDARAEKMMNFRKNFTKQRQEKVE